MNRFCKCKDCKKARRQGLVLGTRIMGGRIEAAYVPHPKFAKGRRRPRRPNNPKNSP